MFWPTSQLEKSPAENPADILTKTGWLSVYDEALSDTLGKVILSRDLSKIFT